MGWGWGEGEDWRGSGGAVSVVQDRAGPTTHPQTLKAVGNLAGCPAKAPTGAFWYQMVYTLAEGAGRPRKRSNVGDLLSGIRGKWDGQRPLRVTRKCAACSGGVRALYVCVGVG